MVQPPACGDMVGQKSIGLKDRLEQNDGENVRIGWSGYPWNTPHMTPLTPLFSDSGGLLQAYHMLPLEHRLPSCCLQGLLILQLLRKVSVEVHRDLIHIKYVGAHRDLGGFCVEGQAGLCSDVLSGNKQTHRTGVM